MLVEIDVKCMYTNFGGRSFFSFGDKISFSNLAKFSFQTMGYKFMAMKKLSGIDSAQKNHASLY